MDDIGGITASKVWHGYADLFIVVVKVDADVLLELMPAPQRSVHRVLVDNPTVEQAVLWDLLMGCDGDELAWVNSFLYILCCR